MTQAPRRLLLKLFLVALTIGLFLFAYLDAVVLDKFSGSKWQVTTQAFARPLELYVGKGLSPVQLDYELETLGYLDVDTPRAPGQYHRYRYTYDIFVRGFEFYDGFSQSRLLRVTLDDNEIASLTSQGKAVTNHRLDPLMIGSFESGRYEDRRIISLDKVPPKLIDILIATEDRDFLNHFGVSLRGIARATLANLRAGGFVQGGSTLTQQLVKNFFLTQDRNLIRKILEIPMAILMEVHFSKEEILEAYINEVFLGQDGSRAIHGFELASQFYFGVPLNQTSLAQQALLVGMVKGASFYNPKRHPERAKIRRDLILDSMVSNQFLEPEVAAVAKNEDVLVAAKASASSQKFPAFMDFLRRQLRSSDMASALQSGSNARVFTTLDPYIQFQAEKAVQSEIARIELWKGLSEGSLEGALVAVHPATGAITALVGGRDVKYQGFNRALDAQRPVGSLLKPAAYLAALASNEYHLATILSDAPISIPLDNVRSWEPKNYDKLNHGDLMLVDALRRSYNQALVRMGMRIGLPKIIETIHLLGINEPLAENPSLLLGAANLTPVDMVAMYTNIASLGRVQKLRAIDSVKQEGSEPVFFSSAAPAKIDPAALTLLQFGLREVVRSGSAKQLQNILPKGVQAAGKTGTSNDGRDSWFAGFTGDMVAVVWVGRDDNKDVGLTGSGGAMQVWGEFARRVAYKSVQIKPVPGMEFLWVDEQGRLAGPNCPGAIEMPFTKARPTIESTCRPKRQDKKERRDILQWFKDLF